MKRSFLSLTTALLTFAFGAVCAISFRALMFNPPEIFVEGPTPRINLSDEAVLRSNLAQMRKLISQYQMERGVPLRALDDLVRAGYLRELPIDPMTGGRDWQPEGIGCPSMYQFSFWAIDGVRSKSEAASPDGTLYSEW